MKVCPNCHTPARFEEQKFCAVCGHHFGENEAPAPSAPQSAPVTPAPAVSPLEQPVPAAPTEVPEVPEAPRPVERRRPAPAPASPADAPEAPEAPRPVERRRPAPAPEAPADASEAPESPRPVERRRPAPAPEAPAETPPAPAPAEEVPLPPEEPAGIPAQPRPGTAGNGIPPQQPAQPMPSMPPQARGNNRTVPLVVLGVVVFLVVVCILVFVGKQFLRPASESPTGTAAPAASETLDAASDALMQSAPAASTAPSTAPAATAAPTPAPTAVTPAVASDTQLVLRNAAANGTITVDGVPVNFTYVGNDAVIPRSSLSDVCQVRIVAPAGDGTYQTAAVWYNKDYGNDLSFGADYGSYVPCDETGLAKPSDKMVDVLTWAFYRSFLNSINTMDINSMQYSTTANTSRCSQEISGYLDYTYDLNNFVAVSDPTSIQYNEADGTVLYNGHFVSYHSNRGTNADPESADVHRTLRLVWQDGMWKVDAFMRLDDDAFNAGQYAAMP